MAKPKAKLSCVVHYSHLPSSSKIIPLDNNKHENLINNKKIREMLGGENTHVIQYNGIPAEDELDTSIGTHSECYKKFVMAKSILKRKSQTVSNSIEVKNSSDSIDVKSSVRRSIRFVIKQPFPNHCMICKSDASLYVPGETKREPIHVIDPSRDAEETIKHAAKDREDNEMQMLVNGGNLHERRFKVHLSCYKDYTRPRYRPKIEGIENTDKFSRVEAFIKEEIIGKKKAVSITKLAEIYGEDKNDRKKRSRLKERIEKVFPDILFLHANKKSPLLVVSSLESITSNFHTADKEELVRSAASELRKDILDYIKKAP